MKQEAVLETFGTLTEVLALRAQEMGDRHGISILSRARIRTAVSYRSLYEKSLEVAGVFVDQGLQRGDRVLIILPTCEAFFLTFWGTLLAGGVPVPIYPPVRLHRMHDYQGYMQAILENCQAHILVTDRTIHAILGLGRRAPKDVTVLKVEDLPRAPALSRPVEVEPDDLALLQYTSGSTATPRGVQLNHRHLLENIRAFGIHLQATEKDVAVSWLPLYHDMGLIGMVMGTLYWAVPLLVFSPLEFLRRPVFWLRAISRYRATASAGPNFAYSVCVSKIRDFELEGLDLSSWRLVLCGAEPILAETIERFVRRYEPYGLNPKSFVPAYGLAENALAVTLGRLGEGLRVDWVDRMAFETERVARPTDHRNGQAMAWVACGVPVPGVRVRIVDEAGNPLPDRHEGRIWVQSPSVMSGYYRNPEATHAVIYDGWLDTGDLGYLADGYLYVTGRSKEIIIRGGRNYYPQEIERVVHYVEGIRKGAVCVFGVPDEEQGTERIVVVAETKLRSPETWQTLEDTVRKTVLREIGVPVSDIVLVAPGTIPKTSSGKLQRIRCRQLFLEGRIHPLRPEDIQRWFQWRRRWVQLLQWLRFRIASLLGRRGPR